MKQTAMKLIGIVCLWCITTLGYSQIVAWQFSDPATTGQEVGVQATNVAKGIKNALLTRGSGIKMTHSYERSFYSNAFSGSKDKPGTKKNAIKNNEYLQVEINIRAAYTVSFESLGIRLRKSTYGPAIGNWQYSLDGNNFKPIGNDFPIVSTKGDKEGVNQPLLDLSKTPELQNIQGKKTVLLRLYLWGAKTNKGSLLVGRYGAMNTQDYSLHIEGKVEKGS